MIKIGLTGSRYSGKDRICKLFKQISIPVFNADVVLKFLLNNNKEVISKIRKDIGNCVFNSIDETNNSFDLKTISHMGAFDKIVNETEFELFKAYAKFQLKNKQSIYTIFHSSILFERGWYKNMDFNINVFAPNNDRLERCKNSTNLTFLQMYDKLNCEMDPIEKNNLSTYIIHNYNYDHPEILRMKGDILKQVEIIDQKIINRYLIDESEKNRKVVVINL